MVLDEKWRQLENQDPILVGSVFVPSAPPVANAQRGTKRAYW